MDRCVFRMAAMQTELSYVRERLNAIPRSVWREISLECDVSEKTLSRMAKAGRLKKGPRSDNVGKVALYFRTKEKRRSK